MGKKQKKITPDVSFVIIAKNEEANITRCLKSVFGSTQGNKALEVILIDSSSIDATVAKAQEFPIEIYRYRARRMSASAGRFIGSKHANAPYVFFIDGDCTVEAGWLDTAVEIMEAREDIGIVYGHRREISSNGNKVSITGNLGGNALYRRYVLTQAGGFNPYIIAEEEAELWARISRQNYKRCLTDGIMCSHHAANLPTFSSMVRRLRRGMILGPGQVLRYSINAKTTLFHLKRFNRPLAVLFYLLACIVLGMAGLITGNNLGLGIWLLAGAMLVISLCYRHRKIKETFYYLLEWFLTAVHMIPGFIKRPMPADTFDFEIEKLK